MPKKASLSFKIDPVYHLRLRDEAIRRGTTAHALAAKWLDQRLRGSPARRMRKGRPMQFELKVWTLIAVSAVVIILTGIGLATVVRAIAGGI